MRCARIVLAAIVAMLVRPALASAHLRSDVVAVDYRATVTTQSRTFEARVYQTDRALRLVVSRGHSVIVLGYLGEPLIRIDHRGVAVNAASPSAPSAGLLKRTQLLSRGGIAWRRVSGREAVTWHDTRDRGLPSGASRGVWRVPLLVDGRPGRIRGALVRFPRPALWPWLVLAVGIFAVGAVAARRRVSTAAIGSGVLAAVAFVASAATFAFGASASPGTWIFGADGVAFAALGLGILIKGRPHLRAHEGRGVLPPDRARDCAGLGGAASRCSERLLRGRRGRPRRHFLHLAGEPGVGARVSTRGGNGQPLQVMVPALRVRFGGFRARQIAMDEGEHRSGSFRHELDLDRGRPGGHGVRAALARLPAERVDEPPRCIELDELAARRVAGDDLDAVRAARARVERRRHAPPRSRLVRIDQELPDRLGTCIDRDRALDDGLSAACHAVSAPLVLPRVSTPRGARPRALRGRPSTRGDLPDVRGRDVACRCVARSRALPPSARSDAGRPPAASRRSARRSRRPRAPRPARAGGSGAGAGRRSPSASLPLANNYVNIFLRK